MQWTARRALGVLLFGLAPVTVLAGCGAEETGARSTLAPIQPSSYVVREPVTTTTVPEVDPNAGPAVDEEGRSTTEQEYTVRSGDAVSLIARRFGVAMDDIAAYNEWPNGINQNIFPGDVIRIPPGALVPEAVTASPDPAPTTGTDGGTTATQTTLAGADGECVEGTYTITAEDTTRTRVANRFDISVDQLDAANANTPGYSAFYPGLEIRIPC